MDDKELLEFCQQKMQTDALRPGQGDVMRSLQNKKCCLAIMPTGGGKSLLWLLARGMEECHQGCRCMGAKFSVLPQRNETAAQMSERGTLTVYSERLVKIGCQLVLRLRRRRRRSSVGARGCGTVQIARRGGLLPPSPSDGSAVRPPRGPPHRF